MSQEMLSKEELAITTQPEYITPAMARAMLTKNVSNRPLKPRWVAELARRIRRGLWKINPQPIVFDKDGILRDGQNRLNAIVSADTGVVLTVARNAPKDVGRVIDEIDPRTWHDRFTALHPEYGLTRVAVSALRAFIQGGTRRHLSRLNFSDVEDCFVEYKGGLRFAMATCPQANKRSKRIATAAMRGALARAFYCVRKQVGGLERIEAFCDKAARGVGIGDDETYIVSLRQQLQGAMENRTLRMPCLNQYRLISRALKAYLDGEPLKRLQCPSVELFPLPHERVK